MKLSAPLKTAVLLVDEAERDFLGLSLLAFHLVSLGFRTCITDRDFRALQKGFPNGVFFGKAGLKRSENPFDVTVAMHPAEGGLFPSKGWKETVRSKYFLERFERSQPNAILAWGARQKEVISDYSELLGNRTVVTGAQRLDLCLPEYRWLSEADSSPLREAYGDFILLCPRFTSVNNEDPAGNLGNILRRGDLSTVAGIEGSRWARESLDFAMFIDLVPRILAEYPTKKFVIRPHPKENIRVYEGLFGHWPNVEISRDGNFVPWLLASRGVLSYSSTSGVEAALAGKPVVNFRSDAIAGRDHDVVVASEAGRRVSTNEHALTALSQICDAPDDLVKPQVWSVESKSKLANLTEASTPRVAQEIVRLSAGLQATSGVPKKMLSSLPKRSKRTDEYFLRKMISVSEGDFCQLVDTAEKQGFGPQRLVYFGNGSIVVEPG